MNATNLPDDSERLARATTMNLTYKEMKTQIKKTCGSIVGDLEASAPAVKDEILYNNYRKGSSRGRGKFHRKEWNNNERRRTEDVSSNQPFTQTPQNLYRPKCFVCDSLDHFLDTDIC